MKAEWYWIFKKVNGKLKDLGECLMATCKRDAVIAARNKGIGGFLVVKPDRKLHENDYRDIHGRIEI